MNFDVEIVDSREAPGGRTHAVRVTVRGKGGAVLYDGVQRYLEVDSETAPPPFIHRADESDGIPSGLRAAVIDRGRRALLDAAD